MNPTFRYSVLVRGREVELPEGEVTLGRSRSATIALSDPSISRVHVRLLAREGRVLLEDLGSANGTYVNGLRINGVVELGDGARLVLGESEVVLRVAKAASPLATRRIDPKDYLCPRCGRPFPTGTKVCGECPAEGTAERVAKGAVAEGAKVGTGGGELLPSIDLPPSPPTAPLKTQNPPRGSARPPAKGLFSRLFGRQ